MQQFPTIRLAIPARASGAFGSSGLGLRTEARWFSCALLHQRWTLRSDLQKEQAVQSTALFAQVCEWDMEGIVCKRKDGVYSANGWLKVLNPNYTQHEGRHEMFTAFHEKRKHEAVR